MPSSRVSRCRDQRERLVAALSLAACLLAAVVLVSAERPNQPPYFALRNARIVPVSGPIIENGTLVVANGLISALGTDVAIPPEAWVIDATGLTVYPGLIDALTTLGLPAEEEPGRAATPSAGQQQPRREIAQGPEDRPATTSWENAADQIQPEDKRLENWRQAGFTSAVTAPDRGLVPGQAALINLAGERPGEMVVRTPVGLRINLAPPRGTRGFPNSLMGVFAYVRQLFIDAEHYGHASAIYENHPSGLERPAYDRSLEPVQRAVKEGWPVLLPATWAKDVHRAIRLGEEINANTLLYGAHQGYEVADVLAQKKVPVLVSVKWPEKPSDADPEAEEPLRELRLRDRAPSTPARFEKAGVKFAFYSDGLVNPQEILANVRKALAAGLSAEAALRALTLSAAEIYGVANRLGSLEVGKIANLTVTDGDLFDEKTKIKMVFIDGRKYEVREPGRPTAPPVVNLTGTWTLTVDTRQGPQERTAELTMAEDGSLTGAITAPMGTQSLSSGWVSGNKFSFTVTFTMRGRPVDATYSGTVEGNRMTGTVSVGRATTEFTGTRPDKSSGDTARREGDE